MSDLYFRNLPVPFLSQRKNTYVFEGKYIGGSGDKNLLYNTTDSNTLKVSMANRSCNITCLAMLLHYFGVTKDSPDEMMKAYFETTIDSVTDKSVMALQEWKNLKIFVENKYSQKLVENPFNEGTIIENLKKYIAAGYPVMMSVGMYTAESSGHIVVVRGFTKINNVDYVILNDPWGSSVNITGDLLTSGTLYSYYSHEDMDASNGDNVVVKLSEFKKRIDNVFEYTVTKDRVLVIKGNLWQLPNGKENTKSEAHFPMSTACTWHNGIHMNTITNNNVCSIGAGRLLALRNNDVENGSASFMLVQHQVAKVTGTGESISAIEKAIPFYALYMHLETIDIKLCAEHFFKRGSLPPQYNYKWLYQLFLHMLPHQCVIANKDPKPSTEGLYSAEGLPTNEGYGKYPVYKADYTSGAGLRKKDPETKVDFFHGRRMLVHLLPRGELFDKLLDPANYTNDYFQQQMLDKNNFVSNDKYIFFHKYDAADDVGEVSTEVVAISESIEVEIFCSNYRENDNFFRTPKTMNKAMFKRNAKKLHTLNVSKKEGGEVVSFTDLKNESAVSESKNVFFSNKNRINSFYFASMQENKNYSKSLQGFEYANISQIGDFFTGDNIKKIKDAWIIQFALRTSEDEGEAYRVIDNFYTAMSALCFEVDTQYHAGDSNKKDILKSLEKYCKSYGDARKESFEAHINAIIANRGEKKYDGVKTWRQYLHRVLDNCLSKKHGTFDFDTTMENISETESGEHIVKTFLYSLSTLYPSLDEQRAIIEVACCSLVSIAGADIEGGKSECFEIVNGSIRALLSAYHDISFFSQFEAYIDYFVEMGKDDVIGRCGRYNDEHDMIHFEIFSCKSDNIYDELKLTNNTLVSANKSDNYYNITQTCNHLRRQLPEDFTSLSEDFFMPSELTTFTIENTFSSVPFLHSSEWTLSNNINTYNNGRNGNFNLSVTLRVGNNASNSEQTNKNNDISNDEFFEIYIQPYQFDLAKIILSSKNSNETFIYYHPLKFIESLITKDTQGNESAENSTT